MRGHVPGVVNPAPMGLALPAVFHEDDLAQRFTAALDEVVAPVLATIDNLEAYLDPHLAPADFVAWLAGWVGLVLDENWPLERRRALVGRAMDLYRWRGTLRGVRQHVELYTGSVPEVEDSGGAAWSAVPGGAPPGAAPPALRVRVRVPDPARVDRARLDRLVAAAKPAHVAHEVEVQPA